MDAIVLAKQQAQANMEMFLRNFSHVPDDKLDYRPTPTSKSPLRVAAHTALFSGRFAAMIRDRKLPAPDTMDEWVAQCEAEEAAMTSRDQVVTAFRAGTAEVIAALDDLTPEAVAIELDSGQGWTMTMGQLIRLPGWHATLHTGQIDYLQTCWGDQQVYVG